MTILVKLPLAESKQKLGKQPINPLTMKYGELNLGQIEAIVNKLGGMEGVKSLLSGKTVVKAIENTFLIHPIKDIREGIKKGKYDWVHGCILGIEANRKLIKKLEERDVPKEIEVELIHFSKIISTENALKELDEMGMRPATEQELLAFGAEHPEEQKKYSIVALPTQERIDNDSVFRSEDGRRCALFLYLGDAGFALYISWLGYDWLGDRRFLAVRLPAQTGK